MMIYTTDNYTLMNPIQTIGKKNERQEFFKNNNYFCISSKIPKEIYLSLDKYKHSRKNIIFSFASNSENDELIIAIEQINDNTYVAKTGNYIGKFTYDNLEIDIRSRFSDTFLQRMLNFANDVFLDDVNVAGENQNQKNIDYSRFIIYYLFVQKLEKAFLLGLPKAYTTLHYHNMKLKGKIDINRFIKYDIPFKGKISSKSREQKEIQEIIDVLYMAIKIMEKEMPSFLKNITHIRTHLKQYKCKNFVSNQTIQKALRSKALLNPIFLPYKKILEYAQMIINIGSITQKEDAKDNTYGFLVNVAELFEIYLYKLLQKEFPDWNVVHEEKLEVYDGLFYKRNMYPDIIMKKDDRVVVFDAKYKRMIFESGIGDGRRGDLDRKDFFQINTYMTYYKNQGYHVVAGGLLYPIEGNFIKDEVHADNWLGSDGAQFIIDGINLSNINEGVNNDMSEESKNKIRMKNILNSENAFINRIKEIAGEN